jgi:hypothetical protein
MRTTAASAVPGRFTVCPPTVASYWFHTQAREHRSGQAISVNSASDRPAGSATSPSGAGSDGSVKGR